MAVLFSTLSTERTPVRRKEQPRDKKGVRCGMLKGKGLLSWA